MMRLCKLVACVAAIQANGVMDKDECPDYADIRSERVAPDVFDPKEIEGIWYLVATTEPTTKFCLCNVMNYTILATQYRYTDTCFQDVPGTTPFNVTLPIGGNLSSDPQSPGIFHEGFVLPGNHSLLSSPNMLFDIKRNEQGEVVRMHFYACLGQIVPVIGKHIYSYLVYSRDPWISHDEIDALVDVDKQAGAFKLDGWVATGPDAWRTCGVLPSETSSVSV